MLRKMFVLGFCLMIGFVFVVPAMGITVRGQNSPEFDVPAVQAAVDGGGTVYLSGTFDFGTSRVEVTKGVSVIGQSGSVINNGMGSFTPIPPYELRGVFEVQAPDEDVTFQNLTFKNFNLAAIHIAQARDVTIAGNKITADTMDGRTFRHPGFYNANIGIGILVGAPYYPKEVTGTVNIENNYLDLETALSAPEGKVTWNTFGIQVHVTEGNINLRKNTIKNATARNIFVADNWGVAIVDGNTLDTGPYNGYWAGSLGCGIVSINGNFAREIPDKRGPVHILNNRVVCSGIDQAGIFLTSLPNYEIGGGSITGNDITASTEPGALNRAIGIALLGADGIYVANNKIDGGNPDITSFAMLIGFSDTRYTMTESNVFVGNNLSLADTLYGVYCQRYTANNVFVGNSGKNAFDWQMANTGTSNNKITGLTPISTGVGSEISEALDNLGKP